MGAPSLPATFSATTSILLDQSVGDGAVRLFMILQALAASRAPERAKLTRVQDLADLMGVHIRSMWIYLAELRKLDCFNVLRDLPCLAGVFKAMNEKGKFVYFVQEKSGGPIKIGSSSDPKRRLKELQTGHPRELMILGSMPGGAEIESELHLKFKNLHSHGEWFHDDPALMEFIKNATDQS